MDNMSDGLNSDDEYENNVTTVAAATGRVNTEVDAEDDRVASYTRTDTTFVALTDLSSANSTNVDPFHTPAEPVKLHCEDKVGRLWKHDHVNLSPALGTG